MGRVLSCTLTGLQGVQCDLAHGLIAFTGGDGDTARCVHRLMTCVALQGRSCRRGLMRRGFPAYLRGLVDRNQVPGQPLGWSCLP